MLKLNSIPRSTLSQVNDVDVCFEAGGESISRNALIRMGRMIACEYFGKGIANSQKQAFNSLFEKEHKDYNETSKNYQQKKFLFCAAVANQAMGKPAPETFDKEKQNRNYATNAAFWQAYNSIDVEVVSPLLPTVFDDISAGGLLNIVDVPLGTTLEVNVQSNDFFPFEDMSWGSSKATTKNYLYSHTVTLNPTMYACNATIKWYQDVVDGDAGRYYAAIMKGMWNKIYAKFMGELLTASSNSMYIPSAYQANTYTSDNLTTVKTAVAIGNGVGFEQLVIFGDPMATSKIIPDDGTPGAMVGLQYGLGREWFENGFLPVVGRSKVAQVMPVPVPGTQNSTLEQIGLGNNLFITANRGNAPIYLALASGTPITIVTTPEHTADFTIDINVSVAMDVKPVFGDKVGMITNVY